MLTLKVFINKKQIDEININNLGHYAPVTDKEEKCNYNVWRVGDHCVYIKHNRKKGWEVLAIKALKKLLKEEKK